MNTHVTESRSLLDLSGAIHDLLGRRASTEYEDHPREARGQGGQQFRRDQAGRGDALKRPLPDHLHQEMVMRSFETLDAWYIEDYFKWCDEWEAAARGEAP